MQGSDANPCIQLHDDDVDGDDDDDGGDDDDDDAQYVGQ